MLSFSKRHSLTVFALCPSVRGLQTPAISDLKIIKTGFKQSSCEAQPKSTLYPRYIQNQELRTKEHLGKFDGSPYHHYRKSEANDYVRFEYARDEQERLVLPTIISTNALTFTILNQKKERMRSEGRYNLYGAMEILVYNAFGRGIIQEFDGMQDALNQVAATPEFISILKAEARARALVPEEVAICVRDLWTKLRKWFHDYPYENSIFILDIDFDVHDRAVLVAFMRLQDTWRSPLDWCEQVAVKGEGRNVRVVVS